jgi:hypothetical protein
MFDELVMYTVALLHPARVYICTGTGSRCMPCDHGLATCLLRLDKASGKINILNEKTDSLHLTSFK